MPRISKSVGQGGQNVAADVTTVQTLLRGRGFDAADSGVCDAASRHPRLPGRLHDIARRLDRAWPEELAAGRRRDWAHVQLVANGELSRVMRESGL